MQKRGSVPAEFIEQVKLSNNIVNVASRYMTVKSKGRTHWGICPFHHEKTPSFAINESQQFYKCFGCGQAGNVIGLVKQLESTDFLGAIELLAKWANLDMPQVKSDPNYAERKNKKERILKILDEAKDFYCKNLYTDKNKEKLEYLYGRGIDDELIKTFNIGASTDWDEVINHLRKKGHKDADILDSGVGAKSDKSGKIYDAMAERITFAIFDVYGSCIGFTGRTMSNDVMPKYRNTSQTMVFDKSNIVYGVDVLKKNKLSNIVDKLIVVEGNVDVIALVGAGFYNTVACMGTAMTAFHAKIFKRFSSNIYLCFDTDEAGKKAALRSVDILDKEGASVRVITLPDNYDPDSFVQKHGKDEFKKLIDEARPLIDYKLDTMKSNFNLKDKLGRAEYLESAVEILKPLDKSSEIEIYLPKVARDASVSIDAIRSDIRKAIHKPKNQTDTTQNTLQISRTTDKYAKSMEEVMAYMLHSKVPPVELPDIPNNLYKRIAQILVQRKRDNKEWNFGFIFDIVEDDEYAQINHFADWELNPETDIESEFKKHLGTLEHSVLERERFDLQQKFNDEKDTESRMKLLAKINELNKKMKALK